MQPNRPVRLLLSQSVRSNGQDSVAVQIPKSKAWWASLAQILDQQLTDQKAQARLALPVGLDSPKPTSAVTSNFIIPVRVQPQFDISVGHTGMGRREKSIALS